MLSGFVGNSDVRILWANIVFEAVIFVMFDHFLTKAKAFFPYPLFCDGYGSITIHFKKSIGSSCSQSCLLYVVMVVVT